MTNSLQKINIIAVTSFAAFFIVFFLVWYYSGKKKFDEVNSKYQLVDYKEQLSGVVTDIHNLGEKYRIDPNFAYITIGNLTHRRISVEYKEVGSKKLLDVLHAGVSIKKRSESDQIQIIQIINNDSLSYTFRLLDDQGFPLK